MVAEATCPSELPQRDGLYFPSTFQMSQGFVKLADPYFEMSLQNVVFRLEHLQIGVSVGVWEKQI